MDDTQTVTAGAAFEADDDYLALEQLIAVQVGMAHWPLFTTDAAGLFDIYLGSLPTKRRQHYNCQACRRFVEAFGNLVSINPEHGQAKSALWSISPNKVFPVPLFFASAMTLLQDVVNRAKVTGIFIAATETWGIRLNVSRSEQLWTHLSGNSGYLCAGSPQKAHTKMAEFRELHGMLCRGLVEYPAAAVAQAVRILKADSLDRSEKALGVAKWLSSLHARIDGVGIGIPVKGSRRDNLIWAAVAYAPPGWCHVKTTMIATLLEDIVAGLPYDDIAQRWAGKMHPLQYQRPSAAPKAGAIDQAEKLVEQLGVAKSLERRFARLDDVQVKLWTPAPAPSAPEPDRPGGVFDHLRRPAHQVEALELPAGAITWDKFRRTVLPSATAIEAQLPRIGQFYGLATAADPKSPPILQWDGLEGHPRNPVSGYIYHGGSSTSRWNLLAGDWAEVTAIFLGPHTWQEPTRFAHHDETAFFALAGCWDGKEQIPLCLFPEILKDKFHGIRAVIEAHSNSGGIIGAREGTANGLLFGKKSGPESTLVLRVRDAGGLATYTLNRWD